MRSEGRSAVSGKPPRAWAICRIAVLVAAVSLACYIPYRYATRGVPLQGLYGVLFPLSALIALAGMVLAVRPGLIFRLPLGARAAVAALSAAWMATGLLCLSTLAAATLRVPLAGLFATFHMLAQHVFLSGCVGGFALAPQSVYGLFGLRPPPAPSRDGPVVVPALAPLPSEA